MSRTNRRKHRPNCESLEGRQLLSNYYLINAASGKALDDLGSSTANGGTVGQWQLTGGTNQQWSLLPSPNGFSGFDEIVNVASGKALDDPGFSTANGATMDQWQPNGGTNQQWFMSQLHDNVYEIGNAASSKALDDPGSSTANGTAMIQWQFTGGANQQWILLPASTSAPSGPEFLVNGYSGKALDDPGSSTANGTTMDQWQFTGGANQQWTLVPLATGYDVIVNASSGKVLEDPGFSLTNGTAMDQWQLNGGSNQQWAMGALPNGRSLIVNRSSSKYLDDLGFSTANGGTVGQWGLTGGANQQWSLFAPNTGAGTSPTWSGFVAATNLANPQANSVSAVSGSWVVPAVTASSSGTTYSNTWVGIDGFNFSGSTGVGAGTVEQIGTEQDVIGGRPVYFAWWEMYSNGAQQPEQFISSITVAPGDSMTASVQYIASGANAGTFLLTMSDNTQGTSFSTFQSSSATQNPQAQRGLAEWVVERPLINGSPGNLANFGAATFTGASAVINGVSGPINSPSWQSQALNMASGGVTYDTTSVLSASGNGFTVVVNAGTSTSSASGSASASAGTVSGTTARTGATASTTFPAVEKGHGSVAPRGRPGSVFPANLAALDAVLAGYDSTGTARQRMRVFSSPTSTGRYHGGNA